MPVHIDGDSTKLSIDVASDFAGMINLTESIYREIGSEGETLSKNFPEEVDLSKR
jgi:hypothetical protein